MGRGGGGGGGETLKRLGWPSDDGEIGYAISRISEHGGTAGNIT